MDNITILIILGIIIWALQTFLGYFQMKNFKNTFVEMRKQGKVAIGINKGFFFSGIIVLIRIDENVNIEEIKYMQGLTVLVRCKQLNGLNGKNLLCLKEDDLKDFNKIIKKGIFKAKQNYEQYKGGEKEEVIDSIELEQLTE